MSLLTAIAYSSSRNPDHVFNAALLHGASWVAQFLGHGLAEKRAPALMDNLIGGMINLNSPIISLSPWLQPLFSLRSLCTWRFFLGLGTVLSCISVLITK